jgi:hypothetical protein
LSGNGGRLAKDLHEGDDEWSECGMFGVVRWLVELGWLSVFEDVKVSSCRDGPPMELHGWSYGGAVVGKRGSFG